MNSLHTESVVTLEVLTLSHKELSIASLNVKKFFSLLSSDATMEPSGAIFTHKKHITTGNDIER